MFKCFISTTMMDFFNLQVVEDMDPFSIAFYRFLGVCLPTIPILLWKRLHPFPEGYRWKIVLRSILGSTNLLLHFYGLKYMPIADVNMMAAASPAITVFFSWHEKRALQSNSPEAITDFSFSGSFSRRGSSSST